MTKPKINRQPTGYKPARSGRPKGSHDKAPRARGGRKPRPDLVEIYTSEFSYGARKSQHWEETGSCYLLVDEAGTTLKRFDKRQVKRLVLRRLKGEGGAT